MRGLRVRNVRFSDMLRVRDYQQLAGVLPLLCAYGERLLKMVLGSNVAGQGPAWRGGAWQGKVWQGRWAKAHLSLSLINR